ncbi:uncharacterized protein LY79DRAFT_562694 [Colletotrichum navitas]|uniref:Uncharacterized protein n=1 Tax=Colletotrichum navitas TaxID=681940 RepID=A0AAD8V2U4_9PEZI|nr:uncharacterized protein LY79DRAFT_562694 [Colletotrichum navitas]KAK1580058.1 hypothetical protein LY79DRAFT_562694 [Colletotrichum navitas]
MRRWLAHLWPRATFPSFATTQSSSALSSRTTSSEGHASPTSSPMFPLLPRPFSTIRTSLLRRPFSTSPAALTTDS